MEGWEDPFNRGTFPWGREDQELQRRFTLLGRLRQERPSLQAGELRWIHAQGPVLAFARDLAGETTLAVLNAGSEEVRLELPWSGCLATDALTDQQFQSVSGLLSLCIPPMDGMLLI